VFGVPGTPEGRTSIGGGADGVGRQPAFKRQRGGDFDLVGGPEEPRPDSALSRLTENDEESPLDEDDSSLDAARLLCSITGWPKSKPLPNNQKIVLNRIKACL